MREYPVFVPHGDAHLAAVITVPDDAPRGLVVLVTGIGASRSHRFQMWTRAARRLADHGLASVRLEYRGMGDSSGILYQWGRDEVPLDQTIAVARFAERATGVERVGIAGNCGGSLAALHFAAAVPECVAAALLLPPVLNPSGLRKSLSRLRRSKVAVFVRSRPALRRVLIEPLSRKRNPTVEGPLPQALVHSRLLFVFGEGDAEFSRRAGKELGQMVRKLPAKSQAHYELRVLPVSHLSGFDSLRTQEVVIDTLVGWLVESFPGEGMASSTTSTTASRGSGMRPSGGA